MTELLQKGSFRKGITAIKNKFLRDFVKFFRNAMFKNLNFHKNWGLFYRFIVLNGLSVYLIILALCNLLLKCSVYVSTADYSTTTTKL